MSTTPIGPPNQMEAMATLLSRFGELQQRLTHMGTSIEALSTRLGHMAELSGRVNAAMMILVGLPRVFRSDLHHLIAYGTGGLSHGGGGGLPSLAGRGGSRKGSGSHSLKEDIAQLRSALVDELAVSPLVTETLQAPGPAEAAVLAAKKQSVAAANPSSYTQGDATKHFEAVDTYMSQISGLVTEGNFGPRNLLIPLKGLQQTLTSPGFKELFNPDDWQGFNDLLGNVIGTAESIPSDMKTKRRFERQLKGLGTDFEPSLATARFNAASLPGGGRTVGGIPLPPNVAGIPFQPPSFVQVPFSNRFLDQPAMAGTPFQPTRIGLGGLPILSGPEVPVDPERGWGERVDVRPYYGGRANARRARLKQSGEGLYEFATESARALGTTFKRAITKPLSWGELGSKERGFWKMFYTRGEVEGRSRGALAGGLLGRAQGLGHTAAMVGLGAGAVASGALQAASPDAFATVVGSVQLLAAAFGRTLMPAALQLSVELQYLAHAIRAWSPQTRGTIAALVGLSIGGVAVIAVLGQMAGAIRALLPVIGIFAGSLTRIGISAGIAAAALVAYALYQQQQKYNEEIKRYKEAGTKPPDLEEYEKDPLLAAALRQKDFTKRDQMLHSLRQSSEMPAKFYAANTSPDNTAMRTGIELLEKYSPYVTNLFSKLKGEGPSATELNTDLAERGIKSRRRISLIDSLWNKNSGTYDVPTALGIKPSREYNQERLGKGNLLLLSLQSIKGQPGYSDVSEAYKKIQLGALNDDPLTRQIKEWQREDLANWAKDLEFSGQISSWLQRLVEGSH